MIDTYRDAIIPIIPCELRENDQWIRGTSHHLKVYHKGKYYAIYRSNSPDLVNTCMTASHFISDDNYLHNGCGSFFLERWILFKFRKQIKEYKL